MFRVAYYGDGKGHGLSTLWRFNHTSFPLYSIYAIAFSLYISTFIYPLLLSKSPVKPYSTSIFMGKTHNFYHQNTIFDALPTSRTSAGACGRRAGATPWRPGVRVWDKNRRVLNLRIKIGEKSGLFHNLYRDFFTSFTKKKWLNRIEGSKFLWVLPDKKKSWFRQRWMNQSCLGRRVQGSQEVWGRTTGCLSWKISHRAVKIQISFWPFHVFNPFWSQRADFFLDFNTLLQWVQTTCFSGYRHDLFT